MKREREHMPVVTMSRLGQKGNGLFGNQIFQYAFLKIYARHYNLQVETSEWIGQYLFGHKDPPVSRQLPQVYPNAIDFQLKRARFVNADFRGYFQYNTSFYAKYKDYFRSLYQPVPEIEEEMKKGLKLLRSKGKTVVGIHLRRGDYLDFVNHNKYFVAPTSWYIQWLRKVWGTLEEPVLFIASDELDKVVPDFAEFNPVTSLDLNMYGNIRKDAGFYPDFYLLTQCDVMAISNSSFSFSASMLNERCSLFLRPRQQTGSLIPYNPWNSKVKLTK